MDTLKTALNATRPLVSPLLISDVCFDTLVMDMNVLHVECLKQTLSKVAGYGIVVFASILKVPLMLNIIKSKSVDGLSTMSVYLETTMYAAVLVYYYFLESPFSTYGEKYVLLFQNVLISCLIWTYASKSVLFCLASILGFGGAVAAMVSLPPDFRSYLILYSSTGAFASRVPQIAVNFQNGHTGVLSLVTLVSAVIGALVRILTVIQEVDDFVAILGEVLPLFLNAVILFQIIYYKEATQNHFAKLKKE